MTSRRQINVIICSEEVLEASALYIAASPTGQNTVIKTTVPDWYSWVIFRSFSESLIECPISLQV